MHWIDTNTNEEAAAVHFGMWDTRLNKQADGTIVGKATGPMEGEEFWYHALEHSKRDPDLRIKIARRSLPINAAWREAATGLRTKIRAARKAKADYEVNLHSLHHLAALHSFGFSEVRGGGYDFMALIPFARLAALDLSYDQLGCNELPLLGVTDRKWMIEQWGEPVRHTTAVAINRELYSSERVRVHALQESHREERMDSMLAEFDEMLDNEREAAPLSQQRAPKHSGFLSGFFRALTKW